MVGRLLSFIIFLGIVSQILAGGLLYAQHQSFTSLTSKSNHQDKKTTGCCCCTRKNSSSAMACCIEGKTPLASPITRICCENGGESTGDSAAVTINNLIDQKLPAPQTTTLLLCNDNTLREIFLLPSRPFSQFDLYRDPPLLYLRNAAFLI